MLTRPTHVPGEILFMSPMTIGVRSLSFARTTARWVSESIPRNSASIFFPLVVMIVIFSSRGEIRAVVTMCPSLSMTTPMATFVYPFLATTLTTDGKTFFVISSILTSSIAPDFDPAIRLREDMNKNTVRMLMSLIFFIILAVPP